MITKFNKYKKPPKDGGIKYLDKKLQRDNLIWNDMSKCWVKNESVRDLMTPKSADELKISTKDFSPKKKLDYGVNHGVVQLVKVAIEEGVDVNTKDSYKKTPIIWVTSKSFTSADDIDIVKVLLENGADVNHKDSFGMTALMFAAYKGDFETVKLLLDNGADASIKDKNNKTAIDFAEIENHRIVMSLLRRPRMVDESVRDLMTGKSERYVIDKLNSLPPSEKLEYGSKYGFMWAVKDAIELWATATRMASYREKMDITVHFLDQALLNACEGGYTDIVEYLLDNVDVYVLENYIFCFECAVDYGRTDIAKLLLDREPSIPFKARNNWALRVAICRGYLDLVKFLLKRGADIKDIDEKIANVTDTPLEMAQKRGYTEVVDYIKQYLKTNESVRNLMTPKSEDEIRKSLEHLNLHQKLDVGVKKNLPWLVKNVIEEGVNVRIKQNEALRHAAWNGYTEIVKMLIDAGADIHTKNEDPLYYASQNGHTEIVKMLLDKGADVNIRENSSALRVAILKNHLEIVKMLLDKGADIHYGHDWALLIAIINKRSRMVKMLLDKGAIINDEHMNYAIKGGHDIIIRRLKKYKMKVNESVRNMMTPKPADEIRKKLKNMSPEEKLILDFRYHIFSDEEFNNTLKELPTPKKLEYGIQKELPWLIKMAFDEGVNFRKETMHDYYIADKIIGTDNMEIIKMLLDNLSYDQKQKMLKLASEFNKLDVVKLLVNKGVDINEGKGISIREAIRNGHIDIVKYLVEHGADVQEADWAVVAFGRPEILKYLLSKGLDLTTPDGQRGLYDAKDKIKEESYDPRIKDYRETVRMVEQYMRRKKMKKFLGVPMKKYNESVRDQMTPKSEEDIRKIVEQLPIYEIHKNYEKIFLEVARKSLTYDSTPDAFIHLLYEDYFNNTIVFRLLNTPEAKTLYDFFVKGYDIFVYGIDITEAMKSLGWKLWVTIEYTRFKGYIYIKPPKVNESVRNMMTPKSEEEVLKSLQNISPFERLINSIEFNLLNVIKDTVEKENINTEELGAALVRAVCNRNFDITRYLLISGADIHYGEDWALRRAVMENDYSMVKYLIDRGANVNAKGAVCYQIAYDNNFKEIYNLLKEY